MDGIFVGTVSPSGMVFPVVAKVFPEEGMVTLGLDANIYGGMKFTPKQVAYVEQTGESEPPEFPVLKLSRRYKRNKDGSVPLEDMSILKGGEVPSGGGKKYKIMEKVEMGGLPKSISMDFR